MGRDKPSPSCPSPLPPTKEVVREELLSFSIDLRRTYRFLRDLCRGRKEAFLKGIILFGTIFLALY